MELSMRKCKTKRVHFIGIGGVSMSGLAAILINRGYIVSGSDRSESNMTNRLKDIGATIYIGHNKKNVTNKDLIVYTAAISINNPEIKEAKKRGIPCFERADFLGFLMKDFKEGIAVAGTHGKTTCTSMISHVALKGNLDPTILVGGDLDLIEGNYRVGNSDCFITEACEYKASFLKFYPKIGIILNIEEDHLDFYKDIEDIENTFEKFANLIPQDGYMIGCAEDTRVMKILDKLSCTKITYGIDNGDLLAKNIEFDNTGCASFTVVYKGLTLFKIKLSVPGKHSVLNSLSAIAVGIIYNISYEDIIDGLLTFKGAHKRFEYKGIKDGVTLIDDYAHHPTEIKVTLETAQKTDHNKIYCVFQPHTYTRTSTLFNEFVTAFDDADELILLDIYAAREQDTGIINSEKLAEEIKKRGNKCIYVGNHEEAVKYLKNKAINGDTILTVGAGDVVKVADMYLK